MCFYIKMQKKFIEIQLTTISKCDLKFNFQFQNKIVYAFRSKFLQINNLSFRQIIKHLQNSVFYLILIIKYFSAILCRNVVSQNEMK